MREETTHTIDVPTQKAGRLEVVEREYETDYPIVIKWIGYARKRSIEIHHTEIGTLIDTLESIQNDRVCTYCGQGDGSYDDPEWYQRSDGEWAHARCSPTP